MNAAIDAGIREPAMLQRLAGLGIEPAGGPPDSFRDYIARKLDETGQLIRTARINAE